MLQQDHSVNVSVEGGGRAAGRDLNEAPQCVSADRGAWAAGRDINQQNSFFVSRSELTRPPRWDSPDLHDCPHCGRQWLSKMAMFCPTCGYSLQLARDRAHREWQFRWELTIVAIPLLVLSLAFTPSLDEAAAARSQAASLTYAMGHLLVVLSGILTAFAGWMWWRRCKPPRS